MIALSGTAARSSAASTLLRAFERDLQRGLRHDSGVGYSAWSSYELVDAGNAMLTVGMDVIPEALRSAVTESIAVLRRLRDRGPDPTELRDDLAAQIRRFSSQPADQWIPFLAARDVLLGRPATASVEELAAETDAVTVAQVRDAALSVWRDLLVSVAPGGAGNPQLTWLNGPPAPTREPSGRRFKPVGSPVTKGALTIGAADVHRETADARISAAYEDVAGLLRYPDGGRQLIRHDGYQLQVEPTLWQQGPEAIAMLDSAVPRALHIPLPERPQDEIPQSKVRRIDKLRATLKLPIVWVPFLIAWVIWLALQTAPDKIVPAAERILVIGCVVGVITFIRQRRTKD
jgi:hypothetical protein